MVGISVIIPTYNREKLLRRSLDSVAAQSFCCDEIIVIDDGSTDDSYAVVVDFKSQNSIPVRYLFQENKGPAAARNFGIRESKYGVLAFLDSDDHWEKKKLELQFSSFVKQPDMMISHTKERWLRRGQHLNQKKKHQPGNGNIFKHCLQLCAVGMSTVMARKELFEHVGFFNEKYRCCEDYDMWIRTSCRYPFLLVERSLTVKEGGREDQVSYQFRIGMDRLRISSILDLVQRQCLSFEQLQMAYNELQKKCLVYGKGCLKHDKAEEGRRYLDLAEWAEAKVSR
jgi:glycosyltransferase involved in cell wall biosynthesis